MSWNVQARAEAPRSLFTELVAIPTLAPHLARPEYLAAQPGAPIIVPQPRSTQLHDGFLVITPGQAPPLAQSAGADEYDPSESEEQEAPSSQIPGML